MRTAIYEGYVLHSRLNPKKHQFNYNVCYFFFDLKKPKELITIPWLLSFHPKNYLRVDQIHNQINDRFRSFSSNNIKKIFVLTQLSYFGFCFNPVSFYYCYDENDHLLYIVSQITNTPWGEKHVNAFNFKETKGLIHFEKDFHVSPFMPMNIHYAWTFNDPQKTIDIQMTNQYQAEADVFFVAHMKLKSKDLNRKNVLLAFLRYPLMSIKTIIGIYWQALRLYLKQVPFYSHPNKEVV
jgi:DUF1365 family protein